MTDYLSWDDLKAFIIGLTTGIVAFFICVGIQRYWSNRSIKSMGLQGIFAVLGLMCLIFFFQTVQSAVLREEGFNPYTMLILFVWGGTCLLSIYGSDQMKKVGKYPESLETIDKRITKLKNKLLGRGD